MAELWSLLWSSFLPSYTIVPAWLRKGPRGGNELWWQDCDGGGGLWRPLQLILLPMFTKSQPSGMSNQIRWKPVSGTKSCFPAQCALIYSPPSALDSFVAQWCAVVRSGVEGAERGRAWCWMIRHLKLRASSSQKGAGENMVSYVTRME